MNISLFVFFFFVFFYHRFFLKETLRCVYGNSQRRIILRLNLLAGMYVLFKQKITLLETTFFIVLLKNVWGEKDKEHYLLSERY